MSHPSNADRQKPGLAIQSNDSTREGERIRLVGCAIGSKGIATLVDEGRFEYESGGISVIITSKRENTLDFEYDSDGELFRVRVGIEEHQLPPLRTRRRLQVLVRRTDVIIAETREIFDPHGGSETAV